MLSDRDIRTAMAGGDITITGADRLRLQPSSLDVCLDQTLLRPRANGFGAEDLYGDPIIYVDPKKPVNTAPYTIDEEDGWLLQPHEFLLGSTVEVVALSRFMVARIEGKSSLGRLGLLVHCTAGFIDAGFHGQVTLELYNASDIAIKLYRGMPIAQLAFDWLDSAAENPYAGKYQGQQGPVASRYYLNWDRERGTW